MDGKRLASTPTPKSTVGKKRKTINSTNNVPLIYQQGRFNKKYECIKN